MTAIELPPDQPEWAAERAVAELERVAELRGHEGALRLLLNYEAQKDAKRQIDKAKRAQAEGDELGDQTLHDITVGPPPEQLCDPFLAPDGTTVIYGRGGVGKGMVSVWLAHRLVQQGQTVMVIDYEGHPKEWSRRARAMGWSSEELKSVHYRAPFGKAWTATKGDLHEVAELVREEVEALEVTFLIIDSYTTATSSGDAMGGQAAAQEFFNALDRIGRPTLVIAHVAGGQGRFPEKPFGSVFVHNLARETWAVEQSEEGDEADVWDAETWKVQPRVMQLELRNQKKNDGSKAKPQFVAFSFFFDGHIEVDDQPPTGKTLADIIARLFERIGKPMTVAEVTKVVREETGESREAQVVRRAMVKDKQRRFVFVEDVFPTTWSLR